jgi:hypothetical protein
MEMFIRCTVEVRLEDWGLYTYSISEYAFILYLRDVLGEFGCVTVLSLVLLRTLAIATKQIALQSLPSKSDTVYDYWLYRILFSAEVVGEFSGFRRDAVEILVLLGCYDSSLGDYCWILSRACSWIGALDMRTQHRLQTLGNWRPLYSGKYCNRTTLKVADGNNIYCMSCVGEFSLCEQYYNIKYC